MEELIFVFAIILSALIIIAVAQMINDKEERRRLIRCTLFVCAFYMIFVLTSILISLL